MQPKASRKISIDAAFKKAKAKPVLVVPKPKIVKSTKVFSPKVVSFTKLPEVMMGRPQTRGMVWSTLSYSFRLSAAAVVGVLLSVTMLQAFEAQIVNVTARIMPRPCLTFDVFSQGYWKNHTQDWILPQNLGPLEVTTVEQGSAIFDMKETHLDKVRTQLFALKLSLAYTEGASEALVPGELVTLQFLADQADGVLSQIPLPEDIVLEALKDRIESVNVAHIVSTCEVTESEITINEEQTNLEPETPPTENSLEPEVLGETIEESNVTSTPETLEPKTEKEPKQKENSKNQEATSENTFAEESTTTQETLTTISNTQTEQSEILAPPQEPVQPALEAEPVEPAKEEQPAPPAKEEIPPSTEPEAPPAEPVPAPPPVSE